MGTEADKQNISVIVTIVAVGAFAMIAVSLAVTAMVRAEVKDLSSERSATADTKTVHDLKAGLRERLSSPAHWADRGKGLVAIPIARAMQLVGDDLRRNPHLATPSLPDKDEQDAGAAPPTEPKDPTEGGHKGELQKQSPGGTDGAKKLPVPAAPAPQAHGGAASVAPEPSPAPAPTASASPTP